MRAVASMVLALSVLSGTARAGCGPNLCELQDGIYQTALPARTDGPAPMVVLLHGAGSSGAGAMNNSGLVNRLLARGYAVIAPTGARRFGAGGYSWNFLPGRDGRDEPEFLKRVTQDAARRFGLDAERVLLAGFSAGGFMVNYLACAAPETFTAYAPVAGGFWRPHPRRCAGPVRLFHTHDWQDRTVPLEGRFLGGGRYQQGDIFAGLEIWRHANLCPDEEPSATGTTGQYWRRRWTDCAPGSALELALHPGGHAIPPGWADMVLDWFETEPAE